MKKFLITFVLLLTLRQCQIKVEPRTAAAQNSVLIERNDDVPESVRMFTKQINGMIYRIFMYDGYESGGIFVVNETKDLLEIEKLKLEIEKLKK